MVKALDPNFDMDEGMIFSFHGEDHSFLDFMLRWHDTRGKVAWYDEAVTVLFSLRHSSRESADAQEIFKIKRDCGHYDVLVSPSFWDIVPDIRERRVKSLLYCFKKIEHPAQNKTVFRYFVAHFSGEKIIKLGSNKKAKSAFRSSTQLFKIVRPDFVEEFPQMPSNFEKEYLISKRAHRLNILEKAAGIPITEGINKLLQPEGGCFDFTTAKNRLLEISGLTAEEVVE